MVKDETARMKEMFDNLRADKYPLEDYNNIGRKGPRRVDGLQKASGRADYTMDIQLPGMLHMRFLAAPYEYRAGGSPARCPVYSAL
jgi:hypothetical protein